MDDMTTPGPNHPAHRGIKDRSRDSNRVIDLSATRVLKDLTGKLTPIEHSATNPDWEAHVRSALEMGNPRE